MFNVRIKFAGKKKSFSENEAVNKILEDALEAPIRAIIENSGKNPKTILENAGLWKKKDLWEGFNALTNKIENLKKIGIVDPLKVTKTAFLNAVSVATTYLTIGAALTEKPEPKEKHNHGGMPGGGMDY